MLVADSGFWLFFTGRICPKQSYFSSEIIFSFSFYTILQQEFLFLYSFIF